MSFSRRSFLKNVAAAAAAGTLPSARAQAPSRTQKVAAIQFAPVLGDVASNLARCESMAREALEKGATWIVLPEFFPTGAAMHPRMLDAALPLDGRPAQMLKELAAKGKAHVSGSFIARAGPDIFNTLVVACPDGTLLTHDKDFPTMVFESAFYAGGEDAAYAEYLASQGASPASQRVTPRAGNNAEGAFVHAGNAFGGALCWEIVRHRTSRRLVGKVDILLASSGWWTVDPDGDWPGLQPAQARSFWEEHQALILAAPARMARQLGVPVVHANFTGANPGFSALGFDRPAQGRYLGSSQIVDSQGRTVARLREETGVLVGEVTLGRGVPAEGIPQDFWLPEVGEAMRRRWVSSGTAGRDYYLKTTRLRSA